MTLANVRKAVAAAVVAIVAYVAVKAGINLSKDETVAIEGVVATVLVYALPNG